MVGSRSANYCVQSLCHLTMLFDQNYDPYDSISGVTVSPD